MPFIPHTEADIEQMLQVLDIHHIDTLFDEIPSALHAKELGNIDPGRSEMDVLRLMQERAELDAGAMCFLGAGAYEHHIPSAVWDIAARGEFMTAYTPYQAEASQGTLQLIYEYQSMMTALMSMDVSNASLYDGGSALAEAILMAVRANRKSKSRRVLYAGTTNPRYVRAGRALVAGQGIELVEIPRQNGALKIRLDDLQQYAEQDYAAIILPFPNYFGQLESVHEIVDWAHGQKMLVIAAVNPIAVSALVPPGEWGRQGADIAIGDGQPLGLPLSSGGPYFGFMCCRQAYVRQMPGRIIGKTIDLEGRTGYTLTLQAREQHIRRSKATSNICTNQGLAVTAATIHMALLGAKGLAKVALASRRNAVRLAVLLSQIEGVACLNDGDSFHEFVLRFDTDLDTVMDALHEQAILPGIALAGDFPDLPNCLLVCATETKQESDLETYRSHLEQVLAEREGT